MQTFLPYADFIRSAKCLDYRRLGKQRVECKQIVLALTTPTYGWQSHPAVVMWRDSEESLALYGLTMCLEWRMRGYSDSLMPFFRDRVTALAIPPPWLGMDAVHESHQSNLLRKDPQFYAQFGWSVGPDLPYVWPSLPRRRSQVPNERSNACVTSA